MVIDKVFIIYTCNRMVCTQSHPVFEAGLPLQIRRLTLTRVGSLQGCNQFRSLLQYSPPFSFHSNFCVIFGVEESTTSFTEPRMIHGASK